MTDQQQQPPQDGPQVQSSTQTAEHRQGNTVTTERHETTTIRDNTPTKKFKLKAGARHFQDGVAVEAGDEVHLTQDQARSFRDKFEPTDDSDFRVQERPRYVPRSQRRDTTEGRQYGQGQKEDTRFGSPIPTPAIPVGGTTAENPLKDPSAVDPSKQGQLTNEQADAVRRGAVDAKMPPIPSLDEQRRQAQGRPQQQSQGGSKPRETQQPQGGEKK